MQLNPELLLPLSSRLEKKINILIVDDYPLIRNSLTAMFSSPLFNTYIASSAREARTIIPAVPVWHGWILDIAMEEEESGLNLLADHAPYPFTIMLSGIRSMHTASRAMELGAYKVFDKDPAMLMRMYDEVCSMAALAYILKGSPTKYFTLFEILSRDILKSADEWAQKAFLTTRQLERIASLHFEMTPRFILALFYSVRYLLFQDCTTAGTADRQSEKDIDILRHHIDFVNRNISRFFPN